MRYEERSGRAVLRNRGVKAFGAAKRAEIRRRCDRIVDEECGSLAAPFVKDIKRYKLERHFGIR